jgi:hypothetical protein
MRSLELLFSPTPQVLITWGREVRLLGSTPRPLSFPAWSMVTLVIRCVVVLVLGHMAKHGRVSSHFFKLQRLVRLSASPSKSFC